MTKEWRVHEKTTGGMLGEGATKEEAVAKANHNINETPDLRKQMETLGDTTKFPEVPAAEALQRIANKRN